MEWSGNTYIHCDMRDFTKKAEKQTNVHSTLVRTIFVCLLRDEAILWNFQPKYAYSYPERNGQGNNGQHSFAIVGNRLTDGHFSPNIRRWIVGLEYCLKFPVLNVCPLNCSVFIHDSEINTEYADKLYWRRNYEELGFYLLDPWRTS